MNDTPPPLSSFEDLRRVGIGYAQDASGEVWTDYNIHDPGVTFLEQTCFALSQLAYQTELPVRDLLTTPQGDFPFRDIGFLHPRKVLRTGPVTRDDLERWLSACDDVDGVSLRTRDDSHPGLYDMIVYGADPHPVGLEGRMRAAFNRVRPLGTVLGKVILAERVDVILHGQIEIAPGVLPDTLAAEIYHSVRTILSGQPAGADHAKGATRATVFEAPEQLFEAPIRSGVPKLRADNQPRKTRRLETQTEISLASHLGLIRALPGVQEVETLSLRLRFPKNPPRTRAVYLYAVLPNQPDHIGLTLTVDGAPMILNATRIREDFIRVRAERVAHAHHHLHAPDWDVLKPGRRRNFDLGHVDTLLPSAYQAAGHRPVDDPNPLLARYRALIDSVLQDMSTALASLPRTFHSDAGVACSEPELYRARRVLLDYLLALQGFEMPATRHTGLHAYRGTIARHRFELSWRLETLTHLPDLQATRSAAPSIDGPGGFLATLALLCDLDLATGAGSASALDAYGLRLVKNAPLRLCAMGAGLNLDDVANLLDLLPLEDPDAQPYTPEEFANFLPFVVDGALCPRHFQRLAQPEAIRVIPLADQKWDVVVDLGDGSAPWPMTVPPHQNTRRDAYLCAARLRATWRALHRRSEALRFLEFDPTGPGAIAPFTAVLLLPGWTARGALPSFRQYVQAQAARLAPAHIHAVVIWQDDCTAGNAAAVPPAPVVTP